MSEPQTQSTGALGGRLWRDWIAPRWRLLALAILLSAITAAAASGYAGLVGWVISLLNAADPRALTLAPWVILGVGATRGVSLYLQTIQTNKLSLLTIQALQEAMYAKLVRADFARLQSESVGTLISRFTNDMTVLRETLVRLANNLLRDTLTIVGAVGWMLYWDWQLTLLILLVYPVAASPVIRIGQRMRKTSSTAQQQMGTVTSLLEESFSGTRMVKTYGLEDYETRRANRSFLDRLKLLLSLTENKARVDPILEIVGGLGFAGMIAFSGWRLINGETGVDAIFGVIAGVGVMAPAIRALGTLNAVVQEGFAALDRIFTVLDEIPEVTAAIDAPALRVSQGRVELDHVAFAYPDGTHALHNVSLKAEPGQTIALVGPSGSGKSTVLNLLPRLYDPQSGSVRIDGTDVRSVSIGSLRKAMALVSQDVTLFDDTVRANIAFGDLEAEDDAIIAAARAADAHDFIMDLPDGYDSPVGPRGSNLSGGQRQRLSIARAILKNAPILLLDEATSALDTESERKVQAALERLSEGRTSLVIAHRLSTVREADWIYVMEEGRVREQGKHDELVAQGGLYAKLCRMQFGEDTGKA